MKIEVKILVKQPRVVSLHIQNIKIIVATRNADMAPAEEVRKLGLGIGALREKAAQLLVGRIAAVKVATGRAGDQPIYRRMALSSGDASKGSAVGFILPSIRSGHPGLFPLVTISTPRCRAGEVDVTARAGILQ